MRVRDRVRVRRRETFRRRVRELECGNRTRVVIRFRVRDISAWECGRSTWKEVGVPGSGLTLMNGRLESMV